MSQEVVMVRYCDVCQKDHRIKMSANVEAFTITVNGFTREIDLCLEHRDPDPESFVLTINELRDFLTKYGRKVMADVIPRSASDSEPKPEQCTCGRFFPTLRKLNMHIGQVTKHRPQEMHAPVDAAPVLEEKPKGKQRATKTKPKAT